MERPMKSAGLCLSGLAPRPIVVQTKRVPASCHNREAPICDLIAPNGYQRYRGGRDEKRSNSGIRLTC
jgi:hypothetical protein